MDLKQAFFPAETQRAPEVIYDQIYQQIANGRLKPGDRLPSERVLAEQFQRSRHVIREALRMLQQDGLITVEVGSAGGSMTSPAPRTVSQAQNTAADTSVHHRPQPMSAAMAPKRASPTAQLNRTSARALRSRRRNSRFSP